MAKSSCVASDGTGTGNPTPTKSLLFHLLLGLILIIELVFIPFRPPPKQLFSIVQS